MTGIFVRIERDGRAQSVELGDLSNAELRAYFAPKDREELLRWLVWLIDRLAGRAEDP